MKIGLVCPYNMYKGGGVQECVRAMHDELAKRGHEVRIITPLPREADKNAKDFIFVGGSADIKSPFHTTAQISVSVNNEAVDEMIAREKFDILHFHEPWVPIVSRQILSRSTCGNVATFHAKLPETMMSKTIERVVTPYTKSITKYLDALTAVSDAAASYIQTLTDDPITIIPNGIDLDRYKTRKTDRPVEVDGGHIVFIGRLERRKGVKYLLQAFAQFAETHPGARLTIAGDGPDRTKLEAQARSLGILDITFTGYVDEEAKHKLIDQADLLCSPALFGESFGIVLLEAMAAGVPIVAGNNPGYVGVMKDRGVLSLVNPKDTAQFARRLELMMYDQQVRALWRDWAAAYVQQFAYPRVVDRYEALYEQVIQ